MKEVSLSGSPRENVGKKDAKAVRNADRVPCVVYGGGNQVHFSVKHSDMEKLVYTDKVNIINIDVEGTTVKTIIQDLQMHPVTDRIQHVDFIELKDDKKVKVDIPVVLEGRSIGVLNGGKLSQIFRTLKVYAVPGEIPDEIRVDISKMRLGTVKKIGDLELDGLTILNSPDAVVCSVKMARNAVEEEEEEEEELDEDGNPIEKAEGEEGGEAAAENAEG